MDPVDQWKYILIRKRKRKQLPLDIEHWSPITLRNIILDVHTPPSRSRRIALIYSDDEYLLKDLVRCPNLDETTLAFIALTASDEIKSFISGTRVLDLVVVDEPVTAVAVPGAGKPKEALGKKKFNVIQAVQRMTNPQKIKLAVRKGINHAVREATSEIIVSVDSDVIIYPTALRELVARFVSPDIAAVGGRVHVSNPNQNWLTKLQTIKYYFGQEHLKNLERGLRSVMCLSGCLTAYRRHVLMELEPILEDRNILGVPIKYGEDRFLTRQTSRPATARA